MNRERITYLCQRYVTDSASESELNELELILADAEYDETLKASIDSIYYKNYEVLADKLPDNERKEKAFQVIISQPQNKRTVRLWPKFVAAASIVMLSLLGVYYAFNKVQPSKQAEQSISNDILPGGNKATLTLASGQEIALTTAKNGAIARQGGVVINKIVGDQIVYQAAGPHNNKTAVQYNKVTTPVGGQYHLTLADGTVVWLNAASSIAYPTTFLGKAREVEITGEAYFEVAHNPLKPFRVKSNGQTVEVLGTHFDVNAYADERSTTTTLLQGSVRVSKNGKVAVLKPGQAAIIKNGQLSISVQEVNAEQAVAWKNGFFEFQNADIQTVMRQLKRWYDVEVEYQGGIPDIEFSGEMERTLTASQVLKLLSHTRAHFRIDGKKIIINPK